MPKYFKTVVTFQEDDTNPSAIIGTKKTVTETTLYDAISYTDAEAKIATEMELRSIGDYKLRCDPFPVREVLRNDKGETWFMARMEYESENDRTGKVKKVQTTMLTNATSFNEAVANIQKELAKWLISVRIKTLSETAILDVIDYQVEEIV